MTLKLELTIGDYLFTDTDPNGKRVLGEVLAKHWPDIRKIPETIENTEAALKIAQEMLAQYIYNDWQNRTGWVPWEIGGNSDKQQDARRIALSMTSVKPSTLKELPVPPDLEAAATAFSQSKMVG